MNKHKRIAILVAPLLVIGGFIAADYYQQRQAEKLPRLQASGDCRPLQGSCRLEAGELQLNISMQQPEQQGFFTLVLDSSQPLEDVLIAVGNGNPDAMPVRLEAGDQAMHWQKPLLLDRQLNIEKLILRLVVTYKGINYFAEISAKT